MKRSFNTKEQRDKGTKFVKSEKQFLPSKPFDPLSLCSFAMKEAFFTHKIFVVP